MFVIVYYDIIGEHISITTISIETIIAEWSLDSIHATLILVKASMGWDNTSSMPSRASKGMDLASYMLNIF